MKQILCYVIFSLLLVGCNSTKMTDEEIIKALDEEREIVNLSETVNNLETTIYDFINYDVKEKDCYITELDLENMQYEIAKAKETYSNINFELIEKYSKYLENKDEKNEQYDLDNIKTQKDNFNSIIASYEKMVQLGTDLSFSKKDYDQIQDYEYEIGKAVHKINLINKDFTDFFKFYALFKYDLNKSNLFDIENILKDSGYRYEYEKWDGKSADVLKSLTAYDSNGKDSITFQGYKNDSGQFDLTLVQYNIGDTGSTVDMSSYSFLGLSGKVSLGGYNSDTVEKPEFDTIEEQYEYLNEIKKNFKAEV